MLRLQCATVLAYSYFLLFAYFLNLIILIDCKKALILQIVIVPLKGTQMCDFKFYGGDLFAFET